MSIHLGIDYGSKLAGTTAICWKENGKLHIESSKKKKDADGFLRYKIKEISPSQLFIDCPLSLPAAYFGMGSDYFYRKADKELKAMSPMFLGGMTARAMQLKDSFLALHWHEVYPKALVAELKLEKPYNKKSNKSINNFLESLNTLYDLHFKCFPVNWHEVDAVLAWISGHRFNTFQHKSYGVESEGIIIV